jgi:hypothetical protein
MLVLDADGRASVHGELDDTEAFHARLDPLDRVEQHDPKAPKEPSNPYAELNKPRGGAAAAARTPRPTTGRPPRGPAN